MAYRKEFITGPQSKVSQDKIDPFYTGKHASQKTSKDELGHNLERLREAQYLLYADASQSLLIVLQGMDASGKDGVIRHLFSGMNPMPGSPSR